MSPKKDEIGQKMTVFLVSKVKMAKIILSRLFLFGFNLMPAVLFKGVVVIRKETVVVLSDIIILF